MSSQTRRQLTPDDEQNIRFWVDALLRGANPSRAAQQLYSIGVRSRGAVRVRGSARQAAASRFPRDTPIGEILRLLQTGAAPEVRSEVASALAELGGPEALDVLQRLILGENRDTDAGVRSAAVDAVGIIGGPTALSTLKDAASNDADPAIRSMARGLIESLCQG